MKLSLGADGTANDAVAGAGAVGVGTQRVTLASDDPAVTALGAVADAAWTTGSGSAIALLKAMAAQVISTAAQAIFPLPTTPVSGFTTSMTGTSSVAVTGVGAGGSGKFNYITQISIANSDTDTDSNVELQDGNPGTIFYTLPGPRGGAVIAFPTPLKQPTANTALYCKNSTTGATITVSVTGFQA